MAYFFCYKIENRFWCYDRYSNLITEVDEPMYELLNSFRKHKFDETLALKLLTPKFSKEVVLQKLDELRTFQKQQNAFLPADILKSDIPYNEEELIHKYRNEVRHIVFNITEDCVLRCKYCKYSGTYIGSRVHNQKSMSYDTIDKAILLIQKLYKRNKPLIIGFYGGEPLMEFTKIQYIVQQIEALFPDTEILFGLTTNGLILKDHQIEFFRKHNFSIKFSLDGPRIIHDRNRVTKNGNGTFERVLKNIKKIKSFDQNYFRKKVGFVVTISPPYDLPAIFNFFESFLDSEQVVIFNYVDPYDTTFFDNFDMRKERKKLREQLDDLTKEYISLKIVNSNSLRKKLLDDYFGKYLVQLDQRQIFPMDQGWAYPNAICLPGLDRLFITTDGKLGICEKVGESLIIGDVVNGFNFNAIYTILHQYRKLVDEMCLDCWAYRLCSSCFVHALKNNKLNIDRKKEDCRERKKSIEMKLKLYTKIKMHNPSAFEN